MGHEALTGKEGVSRERGAWAGSTRSAASLPNRPARSPRSIGEGAPWAGFTRSKAGTPNNSRCLERGQPWAGFTRSNAERRTTCSFGKETSWVGITRSKARNAIRRKGERRDLVGTDVRSEPDVRNGAGSAPSEGRRASSAAHDRYRRWSCHRCWTSSRPSCSWRSSRRSTSATSSSRAAGSPRSGIRTSRRPAAARARAPLKAINEAADQLEQLAEDSRGGQVTRNAVKVGAAAARKRACRGGAARVRGGAAPARAATPTARSTIRSARACPITRSCTATRAASRIPSGASAASTASTSPAEATTSSSGRA